MLLNRSPLGSILGIARTLARDAGIQRDTLHAKESLVRYSKADRPRSPGWRRAGWERGAFAAGSGLIRGGGGAAAILGKGEGRGNAHGGHHGRLRRVVSGGLSVHEVRPQGVRQASGHPVAVHGLRQEFLATVRQAGRGRADAPAQSCRSATAPRPHRHSLAGRSASERNCPADVPTRTSALLQVRARLSRRRELSPEDAVLRWVNQ